MFHRDGLPVDCQAVRALDLLGFFLPRVSSLVLRHSIASDGVYQRFRPVCEGHLSLIPCHRSTCHRCRCCEADRAVLWSKIDASMHESHKVSIVVLEQYARNVHATHRLFRKCGTDAIIGLELLNVAGVYRLSVAQPNHE